MVRPTEAGLEVAQDGVDPAKHRQLLGFAVADDGRRVRTADVGDAGKAGETVGDDGAGWAQVVSGPSGDRLACEAGQLA